MNLYLRSSAPLRSAPHIIIYAAAGRGLLVPDLALIIIPPAYLWGNPVAVLKVSRVGP